MGIETPASSAIKALARSLNQARAEARTLEGAYLAAGDVSGTKLARETAEVIESLTNVALELYRGDRAMATA